VKAPLWVLELATGFWDRAQMEEPFPRNLRGPAVRAFEGDVVPLRHMRLKHVQTWLRENSIPSPCGGPDRALRACLVAQVGGGVIFIDEQDPPDEQRFSLAHELAHWLRDYWQPRERACAVLGEQVLEVFDGKREPSVEERLHSLVRKVRIGAHVHFMERNPDGAVADPAAAAAEAHADRLAFELLAPAEAVAARVRDTASDPFSLMRALREGFGLPHAAAAAYSRLLLPPERPGNPLLERILRDG
jgi:hypothetical protein